MSYFKIGNTDFSYCVNSLKINSNAVYTSQVNAAGNKVVDYVNTKREIEVGIITINDEIMKALLTELEAFNVSISFRNPKTNLLENNVNCIIPSNQIEYYTIQDGKVMYKEFTLTFTEL